MYAYGHEQFTKARKNLKYVDMPNLPCDGCEVCRVTCPSGFDVKNKVDAISTLPEDAERPIVSEVELRRQVIYIGVAGQADDSNRFVRASPLFGEDL